jgi:methionyl-tRNA synthetase
MTDTFYTSTPIYYVNDQPHIGHVYTTTLADVLARHHRLRGSDTFFLTGTDEHATKVVDAAKERGLETQAWADQNAKAFRETFARLGLSNDDFIRTTEDRHKSRVETYVKALLDSGDVYKGVYEGWYDAGQEEYVPDLKAKEQEFKSAINGKPLIQKKEENYFFKLSAYAEELSKLIDEDVFRVAPTARKNEILGRLKTARDVPLSRTGLVDWGIKVPGDAEHSIYVWIDALLNYLTTVDTEERRKYWPADVQFIGKDILWFHAAIWPSLLLALKKVSGYEWVALPRVLYAHSFWIREGRKMSKSLGNFVDLAEIDQYVETFGLDGLRWFLVTQGPLGTNDGDFARERFVDVYNADLANTLGNCASRVATMTQKSFGGVLPAPGPEVEGAREVQAAAEAAFAKSQAAVDAVAIDASAAAGLEIVRAVDGFIERTQPFRLIRDESKQGELGTILYTCAEALRIASLILWPVIPTKIEAFWEATGQAYAERIRAGGGEVASWVQWGGSREGAPFGKVNLFPRYKEPKAPKEQPKPKKKKAPKPKAPPPGPKDEISYEEFCALDIRIARVEAAIAVPKADKLLQLTLRLADGETRTVLSGIREWYQPEDMVGKQVVYLANLAPRKIRGVMSQGMVLAGNDVGNAAVLLQPIKELPDGAKVS